VTFCGRGRSPGPIGHFPVVRDDTGETIIATRRKDVEVPSPPTTYLYDAEGNRYRLTRIGYCIPDPER
jgi:hypothetical protein